MPAKPIPSSEITPRALYLTRRQFIQRSMFSAAALALAACLPRTPTETTIGTTITDEIGNPATSLKNVTSYNNYYEFSTGKESVASLSTRLVPSPWTIEIGGLVHKPKTFAIEDLLKAFPQEERIYRMRCVEGWAMVIPWQGFPLAKILQEVEPMTSAKYVRFVTLYRPEEMPGQKNDLYPWPYQEGLRLDEAYNDLSLIATGLYGESLPTQNGAPLRLVVPWKYGFKSPKSLVRIDLVEDQPLTFWNALAPNEYGFYSNVNPDRPHPRWSQATEQRIGESGRFNTLPFNGYAEQVAGMYSGMDLQVDY